MNIKAMIPLALALVLGLVAAVLVRNAMSHRDSGPAQPSNLVSVVAAKADLEPGHTLSPDDLQVDKVPADSVPGGVFADPAQLSGRVTVTPLMKGQTILETLLAPNGSGAGLAALLPPGYRAFTLEVSECSSVGGMLSPGCHVDVLVTTVDPHTGSRTTHTILQNMKVSAVGRALAPATNLPPGTPPPPPANNVTLMCTPKQAQMLDLAATMARPWLVLRGGRDSEQQPVDEVTLADLGMLPPPAPATQPVAVAAPATQPVAIAAPPVQRRVVEILKAGTSSEVTFITPASVATATAQSSSADAAADTRDANR